VIVWDANTGEFQRLVGSFGPVNAVSFSPESRWVLGAGPTTALLWATSTGQRFYYLRGHTTTVTAAVFRPDGRRIVTSSSDHTVRGYDCDICPGIDGLIRVAEQRLARLR
jgi:WD40 repeat protein